MTPQEEVGWRVEQGWELLRVGRYEEGFALWSNIPTLQGYEYFYIWRAERCLLEGDWKGAIENYLQAHPSGAGNWKFHGTIDVALWLGGLGEAACWDWARGVAHAKAAGGNASIGYAAMLLWWASAHREYCAWRETALSEIKRVRAITRLRETDFYGFLADFMTGFLPEKTLLAVASSASTPGGAKSQRFRAWFTIAASHLACGDRRRYYESLSRALAEHEDNQLTRSAEFLLAFWESQHDPCQLTLDGLD